MAYFSMSFTLIFRSVSIYFLVLFLLRLMGKRQIGEMQPFELVITLIFADLATIPMADSSLPLIHGIIPILTLSILHYILSLLLRKFNAMRSIINGKPIILISPNGIDFEALQKLDMNYNDLQELMRGCGYFNFDEILYAIMQTNGSLTVLPRATYAPATPNDLNIKVPEVSLPIIILAKGKFNNENLKIAKLEKNFIINELKKENITDLNTIALITINTKGKMYIQPKKGEFILKEIDYNGDGNW